MVQQPTSCQCGSQLQDIDLFSKPAKDEEEKPSKSSGVKCKLDNSLDAEDAENDGRGAPAARHAERAARKSPETAPDDPAGDADSGAFLPPSSRG